MPPNAYLHQREHACVPRFFLQLEQLARVTDWLERAALEADHAERQAEALRHRRDRALILLGFWRGFRGDELLRVRVEHLHVIPGQGMTCFLARTKGDRSVSFLGAALGSALDIKPVLYGHAGRTEPVAKLKGFDNAVEQMFKFAGNRVISGLLTPTVCLSYGGELDEMRALPGYNRLRAELSYTTKLAKRDWWGAKEFTFGVVGDNLLNEDIRNSVSYSKDEVLLPGLGVRMFANVKY